MAMSFTVAIVGRPNVGKSTLFNRLVGRRLALVDDLPGVTRDRREGQARLGDLDFTVIDTAGLEEAGAESLAGRMLAQTKPAIEQADAVFFMLDAQDRAGARRPRLCRSGAALRQAGDRGRQQGRGQGRGAPACWRPMSWVSAIRSAISAEHGEGLADLFEALREALPEATGKPRRRRAEDRRDAARRSASPSSGGRTPASRRW